MERDEEVAKICEEQRAAWRGDEVEVVQFDPPIRPRVDRVDMADVVISYG